MKPSYSKSKSACGCKGSGSGGKKRLVKGSPEAKAHMAKLRAMKGKRGGSWFGDVTKGIRPETSGGRRGYGIPT